MLTVLIWQTPMYVFFLPMITKLWLWKMSKCRPLEQHIKHVLFAGLYCRKSTGQNTDYRMMTGHGRTQCSDSHIQNIYNVKFETTTGGLWAESPQKISPNEIKLQSQLQPVSLQHQSPLQVKRTTPRNTRWVVRSMLGHQTVTHQKQHYFQIFSLVTPHFSQFPIFSNTLQLVLAGL